MCQVKSSDYQALDGEIATLRGRLAWIREQMEKAYALLDTAPTSSRAS